MRTDRNSGRFEGRVLFHASPKKTADFKMRIMCQDADRLVSSFETRVGNWVTYREMVDHLSLLGV